MTGIALKPRAKDIYISSELSEDKAEKNADLLNLLRSFTMTLQFDSFGIEVWMSWFQTYKFKNYQH